MSYPQELKDQALALLATRRAKAREQAVFNKELVLKKIPEIRIIDKKLYNTGLTVSKAILSSQNVELAIANLEQENLDLQRRKAELLLNNGFSVNCMKINFTCSICKDTGYTSNGMCNCLKELLKNLSYRKLNEEVDIEKFSFNNFSINYYPDISYSGNIKSPRQIMNEYYRRCLDYACNFSINSSSLLFLGNTGLGKTHLSIAIAGYVIEKGYGLIYSSAQNLLFKLEKERFSRDNKSDEFGNYMNIVLSCDLLIIDDLGAEFPTSFTASTIYNIVNSRLLQSKPTIINSNLDTTQKLEERYSERFVSRIIGNYSVMKFQGKDIRILKKTNC